MNCSFNIRYKPRTTRAFTKSDLTVYDSAGNTALNALTVYGKSEVVDGAIVSAGEGWATVDLGTLTWTYERSVERFYASLPSPTTTINRTDLICTKYKADVSPVWNTHIDKTICFYAGTNVYVNDYDYTDATTFKNSLNGVILAYKLADPTQGNCVAVKSDDGTGINGTMATFSTGTPLRGIPDSTVRDVMVWDGSSGEVTKKCAKVRLADLTWGYQTSQRRFFAEMSDSKQPTDINALANIFTNKYALITFNELVNNLEQNKVIAGNQTGTTSAITIRDTDYTTVSDFLASLGDAEVVYELATPIAEQLTTAENASIAGLRTFTPQTHAQNNAQTDVTVDYTIRVPTI